MVVLTSTEVYMKKYGDILKDVRSDRMEAAIETAAELYLEKGIDEVKMTDIADKCGLGVASLYRYFGTKQGFTVKVAAHIWNRQMSLFEGVYDSEYYRSKSGIAQIEELLKVFNVLYQAHSGFLCFVAAFDAYIIREGLTSSELCEYNSAVLNTMSLMDKAIKKGIADGTVRSDVDSNLFYFTVTHSLMSLCQKLASADHLLDSDDLVNSSDEVLLAIKMYVNYISA